VHSRSEPLLWLQGLAIGAIPLELLLIRLLLAGADPGPVPPVERLLIWGVGVVAPAVALWKRPADWGSLLVLRIPTASRSSDQQTLTARQGGLAAIAPLLFAITALLPLLWWLDESAGLIHEFSPLQEQSRLITLLLSAPVLALIVWQLQQLVQAVVLLTGNGNNDTPAEPWGVERLRKERTSLGLQLLQLTPLQWPAAKPAPQPKPEPEPTVESMVEPEASQVDDGGIQQPLGSEPFTADASLDEASEEYPEVEAAGVDVNASVEVAVNVEVEERIAVAGVDASTADSRATASSEAASSDTASSLMNDASAVDDQNMPSVEESWVDDRSDDTPRVETTVTEASEGEAPTAEQIPTAEQSPTAVQSTPAETPQDIGTHNNSASVPAAVKPEQPREQEQSTALDSEITELDADAGGAAEQHGEQAEPGGGEQSEPDDTPKPPPGGA
jgi:hypothetical protein